MRQYSTSSEGNDEKGDKDGKKPSANDLIYCKYAIFRPAHVISVYFLICINPFMPNGLSQPYVARVLLAKLQLEDLDLILRERSLRWFGHVARSSGAIRTAYDMQIDGKRGAGRPKQTWKKLTEKDCREWKLTTVDPQERSTWRSGVISSMRAASQLPGKGPTDVDDAPAPAR